MNTALRTFHKPQTLVNREFGGCFCRPWLRGWCAIFFLTCASLPSSVSANTKIGHTATASHANKKDVHVQSAGKKDPHEKSAAPAKSAKRSAVHGKSVAPTKDEKKSVHAAKGHGTGKRDVHVAMRGKKHGVPALLSQPRKMPMQSNIPEVVVSLLESGDVAPAVRRLYLEPASVKNMMLIREMERIGEAESGVKPAHGDEHRYYLNLAVAYHNLHLFLKTHGKKNRKIISKAQSAYAHAEKEAKGAHKFEAEALRAALEASLGNEKSSTKFMSRVPTKNLEQDLSGITALASFYAATGDVAKTITLLQAAKTMGGGEQLVTWVQVGDDFADLRVKPEFQDFLVSVSLRAKSESPRATPATSQRHHARKHH